MINHKLYEEDIKFTAALDLPWEKLKDKSFLITGASGLAGSYLVDVLMYKNLHEGLNCRIYALGRNMAKAKERFMVYWGKSCFKFIVHDINLPLEFETEDTIDYVLHMASNTHPLAYSTDPIGTITANIIGTNHLLSFAIKHHTKRFAFASSNEIYGENRGDTEFFEEHYCGYIDSNTLRAGYPESKRCGEALCQAYKKQHNLDIVIPRMTRSYGPTMLMNDTKAVSQFIKKALAGEDIVLKSAGTQYFSYTYVADAVSGLLTVLLKGKNGEAYNIADETSDIMLKDLAKSIAESVGKKVVFELPDEVERAGYSTATKARLEGGKLKKLGWRAEYNIKNGTERTIQILSSAANAGDEKHRRETVLFLTNNPNTWELYDWINARCPAVLYTGRLDIKQLSDINPRLIVSYNYKYIIEKDLIDFMEGNIINLHISYLPWNRGASPNIWSFIDDTPKGVTIHQISPECDMGKILYQKECFFSPENETFATVYQKLHHEITELFKAHWEEIYDGNYCLYDQKGTGSFHTLRDLKELRKHTEFQWTDNIASFLEKYHKKELPNVK